VSADFAFEELGPRGFEQLAVSLAMAVVGAGIEVYGSGKDGGREATFEGKIQWSGSDGPADWDGYTVFQAKQQEHVTSPAANLNWLKIQIRNEFAEWMKPGSRRQRFPQYVIFVTNARLSAEAGKGGVDQIREYIREQLNFEHGADDDKPRTLRQRGLREVRVWHRDYLNAAISTHADVRAAFPALLTVGDILTRVRALPGFVDAEEFAPVLVDHAQTTLRHEQWVRFDEAGDSASNRRPVDQVIVDLPVADGIERRSVLQSCIERGDQILRKSTWRPFRPRHLVITGAPGNGKSTLTKYLTQVYRARFVSEEDTLPTIIEVCSNTTKSMERVGVDPPRGRRWPLRVELAEMAVKMGPSGGPTLRRWLSDLISENASIDVMPATLDHWLKSWPCIIFFDGLDEVTSPHLRHRVLNEIEGFVEHLDAANADALLVVTTRPTGYTERLLPDHFDQIDLDYFDATEAFEYGSHITKARFHDDPGYGALVLGRFQAAVENASAERLLKTPLQVLIFTIILGSSGALPANRYLLFWRYYETVLKREAAKMTMHRTFFGEHEQDITELHERVGLLLQIRTDISGEARARLPLSDLRQLARQRMIELDYGENQATEIVDKLLDVATQRLVLLVADEDDAVSFDVRSLQELMAGRALVTGDDTTIRRNLNASACSPAWRNAWLFAAGRMFADSDHRTRLVLDVVEHCDTSGLWPGWLYPAAPELAAHMLDDGLAANRPIAQKQLIEIALRCLAGPMPEEISAVALGLTVAGAANAKHLAIIRNALTSALSQGSVHRAVALALMHHGEFSSRIPGSYTADEVQLSVDMWVYRGVGDPVTFSSLVRPHLEEWLREGLPEAGLVDEALIECNRLQLVRTPAGNLWPVVEPSMVNMPKLRDVLGDADASELLEICLGRLSPTDWGARSLLARGVWNVYSLEQVGARLGWPSAADWFDRPWRELFA